MKIRVFRCDGVYDVLLLKHKLEESWSFVNLTKGHICPCKFFTINDAIKDLDSYVKSKRILKYEILDRYE